MESIIFINIIVSFAAPLTAIERGKTTETRYQDMTILMKSRSEEHGHHDSRPSSCSTFANDGDGRWRKKNNNIVRRSAFELHEKLMPYFVIVFQFVEHHRLYEGPVGLKSVGRNVLVGLETNFSADQRTFFG